MVARRLASTVAAELRLVARSTAGHHLINLGAQLPAFLLPLVVVVRDSTTANAYFSITWMVGSLFFTISPAVSSSLFAEGSHDAASLPRLAMRSYRFIAMLLVGPMVGLALVGPWVLGLFGADYADAGYGLLLVLIVSAVPDALTNVYVSALRVRHELGRAALLNLSMAAVALGWAWWRVPIDGIVAAGWGWLLGQSLGGTVALLDGRRALRGAPPADLLPVSEPRGRAV
jgi:O-antigen/teichoic acid export membrane protein